MQQSLLRGARPVLALIGMPGSGKSTVGKLLAERLAIRFDDCDAAVEARVGCTIAELFERDGEEAFRDLESEVLADLVSVAGVVATGGGAVLRPLNRELLRARTHCVYLRVPTETLIARLRHNKKRPMFLATDVSARVHALLAVRHPLYQESAAAVVETVGLSLSRIADAVMRTIPGDAHNPGELR